MMANCCRTRSDGTERCKRVSLHDGTRPQLILQSLHPHTQLRVFLTLRRIYSHRGNVGNVCADNAALLLGLVAIVSIHVGLFCSLTFLFAPLCSTTNFVRGCNDHFEFQHDLRDARSEHTQTKTVVSCLDLTLVAYFVP